MGSDGDDDDAARRKQEINMFAAMALGDSSYFDSPTPTTGGTNGSPGGVDNSSNNETDGMRPSGPDSPVIVQQQRQDEQQTATTAGRNIPQGVSRRRYVTADSGLSTLTSITTESSSTAPTTMKSTDAGTGTETGSVTTKDSAALFREAANNIEPTGTFTMASASNENASAVNSNLEAAAAALAGRDTIPASMREPATFASFQLPTQGREDARSRHQTLQMHFEKVLLPRPLFFGPMLPPQVLKESQKLVRDAIEEMKLDPEEPGLVGKLPPSIRNLVGAVETYGYGLSALPGAGKDVDENDPSTFTGTPYLTTYQPVWGDATRAKRRADRQRRKLKRAAKERAIQEARAQAEAEAEAEAEALRRLSLSGNDETASNAGLAPFSTFGGDGMNRDNNHDNDDDDHQDLSSRNERDIFLALARGGFGGFSAGGDDDMSLSFHREVGADDDNNSGPSIRLEDFDSESSLDLGSTSAPTATDPGTPALPTRAEDEEEEEEEDDDDEEQADQQQQRLSPCRSLSHSQHGRGQSHRMDVRGETTVRQCPTNKTIGETTTNATKGAITVKMFRCNQLVVVGSAFFSPYRSTARPFWLAVSLPFD